VALGQTVVLDIRDHGNFQLVIFYMRPVFRGFVRARLGGQSSQEVPQGGRSPPARPDRWDLLQIGVHAACARRRLYLQLVLSRQILLRRSRHADHGRLTAFGLGLVWTFDAIPPLGFGAV
jgi:hypothetical protein